MQLKDSSYLKFYNPVQLLIEVDNFIEEIISATYFDSQSATRSIADGRFTYMQSPTRQRVSSVVSRVFSIRTEISACNV